MMSLLVILCLLPLFSSLKTHPEKNFGDLDAELLGMSAAATSKNNQSSFIQMLSSSGGQTEFEAKYNELMKHMVSSRPMHQRLHKTGDKTVIAVCMSSTSRHTTTTTPTMFQVMMPSLAKSLSPEANVEIWVYINVDEDDLFNRGGTPGDIQRQAQKMLSNLAVPVQSVFITTPSHMNFMHKPGPAFNFATRAAYEDGADYMYRANDDTEFDGTWIAPALANLRSFNPENVGVTGPNCEQGNTEIMTHDMIHRYHIDIFSFHYPPSLTDWGLDDWISRVYGPIRTKQGPFHIFHRIDVHGQSYKTSEDWKMHLDVELQKGKATLEAWFRNRNRALSAK